MLFKINSESIFTSQKQIHYAFYSKYDITRYPQVHDFYEIVLVTDGKMRYKLNSKNFVLNAGSLVFVRPGDIHSKIPEFESKHINLAFTSETMNALFNYLYDAEEINTFLTTRTVPIVTLPQNDKKILQVQIERLSLISYSQEKSVKKYLRILLIDIIDKYFMPIFLQKDTIYDIDLPVWFAKLLHDLDELDNLSGGMTFLCEASGKTKEYLCRTFQKFLHTTPISYINARKLDYVANMLQHSNYNIISLAYDAGFESLSNFYHLFKKEYGVSPKKYRLKYQ